MNEEVEFFDYIVVGAGINGSWTAYHLSKRGFKVLLLDQVSNMYQSVYSTTWV